MFQLGTRNSKLDPIVPALVIEQPELMFVRPILKAFTVCVQEYAPAGRNHLSAHLAFDRSTERHIRKISVGDCCRFDFVLLDRESRGEILSRSFNRFFSTESHLNQESLRDISLTLETSP